MEINKDIIAAGNALMPALQNATKAMQDFGRAAYELAENQYLKQHGKLPGSDKTKRLRKKRKSIIISAFTTKTSSHKINNLQTSKTPKLT